MTPFGRLFRRLLFDNFWLKLVSLVFALSLYGFIHSAQDAQRTIPVKLVVEKPPESVRRRLMTDIPYAVDVTVVGPLQQLESLREDDLFITLNLQAAESIPELELTPDMIQELPPRVVVERIYPSRLEVRFEPIIDRPVSVQVARTGTPKAGLEVTGKTIVDPEEIIATGIESAVSTIQFARAEAFDVSGLDEGVHERLLRLDPPPDLVVYDTQSVRATVEIARKVETKVITEVKVEVVGLARATVKPPYVTVTVKGAPDVVERLTKAQIVPKVYPIVQGSEIPTSGSIETPIVVDLPNLQIELSDTKALVAW
ncbi:MAG: YbbR-like domain-containing protein [Polyangiaceae bacterium]